MWIIPISADLVSGSQFTVTPIGLRFCSFWIAGDCSVPRASGDGLMDRFSSGCSSLAAHHQWSYLAAVLFRALKHRNFLPHQGTVLGLLVTVIFIIDENCKDPKSFKNIQSSFYTFDSTFASGFLHFLLVSGLKHCMGWVLWGFFFSQIRCITELKIIREELKEHFKAFIKRLLGLEN